MAVVHSILPETLTAAVDDVLVGIEHVAHGERDIVGAASRGSRGRRSR